MNDRKNESAVIRLLRGSVENTHEAILTKKALAMQLNSEIKDLSNTLDEFKYLIKVSKNRESDPTKAVSIKKKIKGTKDFPFDINRNSIISGVFKVLSSEDYQNNKQIIEALYKNHSDNIPIKLKNKENSKIGINKAVANVVCSLFNKGLVEKLEVAEFNKKHNKGENIKGRFVYRKRSPSDITSHFNKSDS